MVGMYGDVQNSRSKKKHNAEGKFYAEDLGIYFKKTLETALTSSAAFHLIMPARHGHLFVTPNHFLAAFESARILLIQ